MSCASPPFLGHGEGWGKQTIVQVVGLSCYTSKQKERKSETAYFSRVLFRLNGNALRFWATVLGSRTATGM